MDSLATLCMSGKRVLFITGSGINGSEPFVALSSHKVPNRRSNQIWATQRKFNKDPLSWWNKFWLRSYPVSRDSEHLVNETTGQPLRSNICHRALAHMAVKSARQRNNLRVVTRNIDGLQNTVAPDEKCGGLGAPCLLSRDMFAEARGCLGMYRCSKQGCPNSSSFHAGLTLEQCLARADSPVIPAAGSLIVQNKQRSRNKSKSKKPSWKMLHTPRCGLCNTPILPHVRLLDETHNPLKPTSLETRFRWKTIQRWISESSACVLVGISPNIGSSTLGEYSSPLVASAIRACVQQKKQLFSMAVFSAVVAKEILGECVRSWDSTKTVEAAQKGLTHIEGPCSESLPLLAWTMDRIRETRIAAAALDSGDVEVGNAPRDLWSMFQLPSADETLSPVHPTRTKAIEPTATWFHSPTKTSGNEPKRNTKMPSPGLNVLLQAVHGPKSSGNQSGDDEQELAQDDSAPQKRPLSGPSKGQSLKRSRNDAAAILATFSERAFNT